MRPCYKELDTMGSNRSDSDFKADFSQAASNMLIRANNAESRRARVLLVEDDTDVAQVLATTVEMLGHEVHLAHDGETAIEAARAFQPDFVLLDIGLPMMSGFEVAQQLRTQAGSEK